MKHKRAFRRDDGAAMVEFAIILPVLLIILLGIINFGYTLAQKHEITSAARQGGRAAVVQQSEGTSPEDKAETAAENALGGTVKVDDVDIDTSGTICGTGSDPTVGKDITVTVTIPNYNWLTPIPFFDVPHPEELTSTAVYRCEY